MASLAKAAASPEELASENPSHVVWRLAWPVVALNSLQVVNNLLDRFFIGHLPTSALTAHGASTNVMFLMFSLAVSVSTGATALVSRAFGAEEPEQVRRAARESLNLAVIGGLAMSLITFFFAPAAARAVLPASDPAAIRQMSGFLAIYALGLPAIYSIQILAGSLRGVGDTKSPMVLSGLQILLHILLNLVLVLPSRRVVGIIVPGAGLGLSGTAIALTSSAWISAVGYALYIGRTPLGAVWRLRIPSWGWSIRILRIAAPAAVMATLRVLSLTAFTLVLALTPTASAAIAAMGIGFAIESVMFMPAFGLSAAAGALVGQSLGMRRPDRAERIGWVAGAHAALVTVALTGPVFVLAPTIAATMLPGKPEIVAEVVALLRFLVATEFLFCYAMVLIGAMQGAGDTVAPMWISIVALWGLRVPLAFLLALRAGQPLLDWLRMPFGLGMGSTGAWLSMALTQGVQGVLAWALFRRGAWKLKRV